MRIEEGAGEFRAYFSSVRLIFFVIVLLISAALPFSGYVGRHTHLTSFLYHGPLSFIGISSSIAFVILAGLFVPAIVFSLQRKPSLIISAETMEFFTFRHITVPTSEIISLVRTPFTIRMRLKNGATILLLGLIYIDASDLFDALRHYIPLPDNY